MATIKSYTDLEQSRKLADILPLESADMCWQYQKDRWVGEPDYQEFPQFEHATDKRDIPCWSLSALLSLIPEVSLNTFKDGKWNAMIQSDGKMIYADKDNPIDTCYELILKLHELNLL